MKNLCLALSVLTFFACKKQSDYDPARQSGKENRTDVPKLGASPELVAFIATLKDTPDYRRSVATQNFKLRNGLTGKYDYTAPGFSKKAAKTTGEPTEAEIISYGEPQIYQLWFTPPQLWLGQPTNDIFYRDASWNCVENLIGLWKVVSTERIYARQTNMMTVEFVKGTHFYSSLSGFTAGMIGWTQTGGLVEILQPFAANCSVGGTLSILGNAQPVVFSRDLFASDIWPTGIINE